MMIIENYWEIIIILSEYYRFIKMAINDQL
jgi:hypothetical protein